MSDIIKLSNKNQDTSMQVPIEMPPFKFKKCWQIVDLKVIMMSPSTGIPPIHVLGAMGSFIYYGISRGGGGFQMLTVDYVGGGGGWSLIT